MKQGKTEEMRQKNKKKIIRYLGYVFVMAAVLILCGRSGKAEAGVLRLAPDTSGSLDENGGTVFYAGKVTAGTANVRTGPSSDSEDNKLNVGGTNVKLKSGDAVTILEEVTNTKNEKWFHIRFTYEGEQVEGYCLAKFIAKSDVTITPTPTPSPTPTPEPSTEPTTAAPTTEAKPTAAPEKEGKGGGLTKILLIVFLILFVLAAAYIAYYFLVYKKQKEEQRLKKKRQQGGARPANGQREPGENGQGRPAARSNPSGAGRTTGQPRPVQGGTRPAGARPAGAPPRKPAGSRPAGTGAGKPNPAMPKQGATSPARPSGAPRTEAPAAENGQMQAVKPKAEAPEKRNVPVPERTEHEESKNLFSAKPQEAFTPEDRTALREEINNLEAGDYVMHKYLGVGQVYDNSDVKLIEIRFGSDMRFLNKESCIMKRILRKCREDEL